MPATDAPAARRRGRIALVGLLLAVVLPPLVLLAVALPHGEQRLREAAHQAAEHVQLLLPDPASSASTATTPPENSGSPVAPPVSGAGLEQTTSVQCGVVVGPATPGQLQALAWLRVNLAPRSAVVAASQFHAALCAQSKPANLAVPYQPSLGADPATWPVDVVVSTEQLRAQVDPAALEKLPLLASFGDSSSGGEAADPLIQVRQRRALPDLRAAAAALRGIAGVQVQPVASQVLDQEGIDPRLVTLLRGFCASTASVVPQRPGQPVGVSVAGFPLATAQDDPAAPRRVMVVDAFDGHSAGSPVFDQQAGQLQQYVASLPDDQRPASSGVVLTASGQQMFQVSFLLPVG